MARKSKTNLIERFFGESSSEINKLIGVENMLEISYFNRKFRTRVIQNDNGEISVKGDERADTIQESIGLVNGSPFFDRRLYVEELENCIESSGKVKIKLNGSDFTFAVYDVPGLEKFEQAFNCSEKLPVNKAFKIGLESLNTGVKNIVSMYTLMSDRIKPTMLKK